MRKSNGDRVKPKEDGKSPEVIKDRKRRSLCASLQVMSRVGASMVLVFPGPVALNGHGQPEDIRLLPWMAVSPEVPGIKETHTKRKCTIFVCKGGGAEVACSPPLKDRTDGTRPSRQPTLSERHQDGRRVSRSQQEEKREESQNKK